MGHKWKRKNQRRRERRGITSTRDFPAIMGKLMRDRLLDYAAAAVPRYSSGTSTVKPRVEKLPVGTTKDVIVGNDWRGVGDDIGRVISVDDDKKEVTVLFGA